MISKLRRAILHPLILAGALIAIAGLGASIVALLADVRSGRSSPYQGLLTFVLYPLVTFAGLLTGAVGLWLERRRARRHAAAGEEPRPLLDPSIRKHRLIIASLAAFAFLFLVGTVVGAFRAFEYSESTEFCGALCHAPMEPQYAAYPHSPHAEVACVECHVGPGITSWVDAKLSGVRQLRQMIAGTWDRPIRADLRRPPEASETCERCHAPGQFRSVVLDTRERFGFDIRNSRRSLRMMLRTGDKRARDAGQQSVHWHGRLAGRIRFRAIDPLLEDIVRVEVDREDGSVIVYDLADESGQRLHDDAATAKLVGRTMDCLDCHNRPAHRFLPPGQAVDAALAAGDIDPTLPLIKSIAVRALSRPYSSADEAAAGIDREIGTYYESKFGGAVSVRREALSRAREALAAIYRRNVFPSMRVDWKTYPDNAGHQHFRGCFRCHAGRHRSAAGVTLPSDCSLCHSFYVNIPGSDDLISASDDASHVHPFTHPEHARVLCHECHTGAANPYDGCRGCHDDLARVHVAELELTDCSICHEPGAREITGADCAPCHPTGSSPLHAVERHGDCLGCHRPHAWRVDDWQSSCSGCHARIQGRPWKEHHPGLSCSPCHDFRGVGSHVLGLPVEPRSRTTRE